MKIAVVPGDGIGVDVTAEAVKVLDRVGRVRGIPFEPVFFPWSADHYLKTGVTIPDAGDHVLVQVFSFRNCPASGDPWNTTSGGSETLPTTVLDPHGVARN